MREDFWEYRPEFKLWLATNHKPQIKGTDCAIWRRIRLIPFDVTFHAPETGKTPQQGPTLPGRLREEATGILAWAVSGCLAWQCQGLGSPDAVRDATEAYRAEMDVFAMFFEERCVFEESAEVRASDLYRAYASWCEGAGERVESQRSFGQQLTEKGCERYRNNGIWYLGVRLRATNEAADGRTEQNGT
jgi:putative DNA primase/helicase